VAVAGGEPVLDGLLHGEDHLIASVVVRPMPRDQTVDDTPQPAQVRGTGDVHLDTVDVGRRSL
jgi:hypothetical protein